MKLPIETKILIVGLGLIGGSYAAALSEKGYTVGALDVSADSLRFALDSGWIADGRTDADAAYIGQFDLVVFALYPHILTEWLSAHQDALRPHALLTDVTGVKSCVVHGVQGMLRPDVEFIGAHPMAGREVSGVKNARADLFEGANYIVTPTEQNTREGVELCRALGETLGCRTVTELTPERHDEVVGFLSHLTHCIAVALMTCRESGHMCDYTGDSFRDLTRIAKINDEMWSELFLLNKTELLEQMELFETAFDHLRTCLERDDRQGLREMMRLSTQRRAYFDSRE